MDGYYHSVLVLHRWPKVTHPGMVRRLTDLPLLDYSISVNVEPLSPRAEITRRRKHTIARRRLPARNASPRDRDGEEAEEDRRTHAEGHTLPFQC